jgi:two-component system, OmpR family, sensor histidine kinase KdpD
VLAGALGGIAAVTAICRAIPNVSPTTVAMALLLVVLASATLGRLWTAALSSVVATLTFNFFFFPPAGTFTIADPHNWVALFAFLVVAVIASKLSTTAQERAREAIARRNEVTRLFDLTRDVLLTTETAGAIDALARHVARRFELAQVAICLPGETDWRIYQGGRETIALDPIALDGVLARARGTLEFDAVRPDYGGHTQLRTGTDVVTIVPLRHGTRAVGLLAAVATSLDIGTLDALAGVVAIAIERAQFLAERELAEIVRQKGELASTLLASLSHDLKTPLTAIHVAVENLNGDLPSAERKAQAQVALAELDRLNRLFQDLLDMARIDAAAVHVDRQWVTPAEVVDAAAAYVRHALRGRRLRVDADADREAQIDPRIASAALAHLLENAAQYSPVDGEICVFARAETDGFHVSVVDHGPGLDPNELEHLFERFYRGRIARQASPGTGMGLAITRGLLTAAGGHVWAENAAGAGSRFSMVIPAAVRAAAMTEQA